MTFTANTMFPIFLGQHTRRNSRPLDAWGQFVTIASWSVECILPFLLCSEMEPFRNTLDQSIHWLKLRPWPLALNSKSWRLGSLTWKLTESSSKSGKIRLARNLNGLISPLCSLETMPGYWVIRTFLFHLSYTNLCHTTLINSTTSLVDIIMKLGKRNDNKVL